MADIGTGPVPLTRLEFLLLRELAEHPGQSVTKGQLLATVWGYDFDPGSNVVDVCVRRLRSKLGFDLIKTVVVRAISSPAADAGRRRARPAGPAGLPSPVRQVRDQARWPFRPGLLDAAWAVFSAVNLAAILAFPLGDHASHLTGSASRCVYGFRTSAAKPTLWGLGVVIVSTAAAIGADVARATSQPPS